MTNILFFSTINRDDGSASSSSRSQTSEPPETVVQASLSAYSVISKAWSACSRPQLQVDEDADTSTTSKSASAEGDALEDEYVMKDSNLESISYMQLKTATNEFHSSNLLGRGEFGSVFKGWINENTLTAAAAGKGIAVAVKKLHQGGKWLEKVKYEGRFHHPNLVRTLAYCTQGEQPVVVYEFMPRGSLGDHLFQRAPDSKPLSWSLRIKIALGAAKCLCFLHMNGAVHGNIKPSNILLDSDYNSKLSFGVANTNPGSDDIETIYGPKMSELDFVNEYTAPDCIILGDLTAEGDVYSFGVVLLEIIVGRKVTESEVYLAQANRVKRLIYFLDRRFRKDEYAKRAIELVNLCLDRNPYTRITMDLVIKSLTLYMERC